MSLSKIIDKLQVSVVGVYRHLVYGCPQGHLSIKQWAETHPLGQSSSGLGSMQMKNQPPEPQTKPLLQKVDEDVQQNGSNSTVIQTKC